MKNYYQTLNLLPNSSQTEIRKAFRILAVKYHPDKNQGDEYFSNKFIEIKEAYDTLIDDELRDEYDKKYKLFFESQPQEEKRKRRDEHIEKKQKEKETEEKFFYEPFKPFYSERDRNLQDTPQVKPIFNLSGKKLNRKIDFFTLPKNIGKIVGAYSDLTIEDKPFSQKEKNLNILKAIGIGAILGSLIFFIAGLSNPFWIIFWYVGPSLLFLWMANNVNSFEHVNLFVGINGFAEYKCKEKRENIIFSREINFNDITDLYVYKVDKSLNYSYQGTDFLYLWMNTNNNNIYYTLDGTYDKKAKEESLAYDIVFMRKCEQYWTLYLLDKMEEKLQKDGYILFNLYSHENNFGVSPKN